MRCKSCEQDKPETEFTRQSRVRCRACLYAASRQRYAERYAKGRRAASVERHHARLAGRSLNLPVNEAAYIAGIIDGEGWIGIHQLGKQGGASRRTGQYRMCVEVGNTNEAIIRFLHSRLGGSVSYRNGTGRNKGHWKWQSSSFVSLFVLDAVLPYLIIKRRQAILCRRFQRYTQSPSRIVTPKMLKVHERFYQELSALNKRGVR